MIGRERTGSKLGSRVASPDPLRQQAVYLYAVIYDGRRALRCTGYLLLWFQALSHCADGCIFSLLAVASGYLLLLSFA